MKQVKKVIQYIKKDGMWVTIKKVFRTIRFRLQVKFAANYNKIYEIPEAEKPYVTLKSDDKRIYIFMGIPYYDVGGGQRGSQFSKTFNQMGYLVDYIYLNDSGEATKHKLELPLNSHVRISDIKLEAFQSQLCDNDIFIFENPAKEFLPFLECAKKSGCKIVYESIDNWETSLGNGIFDREHLKLFLEYSDVLTATSQLLVEQLEGYLKEFKIKQKKVHYLANAVDSNLFDYRLSFSKPDDMVIGEKTILYYGSLWLDCFDWDLLFEVANKVSGVSINLIGEYGNILDIVKKAPNNVHFLGLKKQPELPGYLKYADFAILPFRTNETSLYVSPLKIFEYVAIGKMVLATNLPDIQNYPNIYQSDHASDWISVIEQNTKADLSLVVPFVRENDWNHRCSCLLSYLSEEEKCDPEFYDNISFIILNYNNRDVIFQCIDTIQRFNDKYQGEIIVVDNQSTDGSYELLKKQEGIKLYQNTKNGCSSGRNLGIRHASKKYVMFLDSDQWVLYPNWLDSYFSVMKDDEKIGAIGWAAGWFNPEGYSGHDVDHFPYRYMPPSGLYRTDIGCLGTGGMMIRKEILEQIGGFDEAYDPTCYEDTDLSLSVRDAGYLIVYCPYLGVGHFAHQSTKIGSDTYEKMIQEKGNYFVSKWKKKNPELLKYVK